MRDRGLRYWLLPYLNGVLEQRRRVASRRGKLCHVMFLICDHFEPRHHITEDGQDVRRLQNWLYQYPELYKHCVDEYGHGPRHTWFYPPHHGLEHLWSLRALVYEGMGEVELHLHHDNDDAESLGRLLDSTIEQYNSHGLLIGCRGNGPLGACFSFVHGDWALANSHPNGEMCGVDNELELLAARGCWGDFTMPSANECQTRTINSIYYASALGGKKAHDRGAPLSTGRAPSVDDFFLMQGPLGINWRWPSAPKVENASLTGSNWGRADRLKSWLSLAPSIVGRPDWVFIKLHCHGAVEADFDAVVGEKAREMHALLNREFNDGTNYRLHYVTAREAYNICKAAESGCEGDPEQFRDHLIAEYPSSHYLINKPHRVLACDDSRLAVEALAEEDLDLALKVSGEKQIHVSGHIRRFDFNRRSGVLKLQTRTNAPLRWRGEVPLLERGRLVVVRAGYAELVGVENELIAKVGV